MKDLLALDRWFFGYGSPVTMGVFRIVAGGVIFLNFVMVGVQFDAWFAEDGFAPWSAADRWLGTSARFGLLHGINDTRLTLVFYVLVTLAALLTTFGLWTRIASIFLLIGLITLHHRNPIMLHGGDTLMRANALYLALMPCGAACSLDRLIALRKGKAPLVHTPVSLWPQRLVQFQVMIIYFTTVWLKWGGTHWRDGTATWYPSNISEFNRFPVPGFLDKQPWIMITTYGTLLVEFCMATVVFYKPLRKWVLLAGLLMHAAIEYRFNIPLFGFAMCSTYVCFYDGEEITAWWQRLQARFRRTDANKKELAHAEI